MQPQQYQYPQPQQPPMQPQNGNGGALFVNPAAPGGGDIVSPKIYELDGCLVFFEPTAFTAAGTGDNLTGYGKDAPRDRITTNVVILETRDGQPLAIGRSEPHTAPTHVVTAPVRLTGVWLSNTNIVKALAPGGQPLIGAKVLGRIVKSEIGQKPWNVVAVDGTPDMAKAVDLLNRIGLGQLTYSEPQPLNPPAPANVVQYGVPVPQQAQQPMTQAPGYPPMAQEPGYGAPVPAIQQWTGAPAGAFDNNPQPPQQQAQPAYGWPQSVPQPPVPQPPAQSFVVQPVPPHLQAMGWTEPAWHGLTDAQKGQVLQANPA